MDEILTILYTAFEAKFYSRTKKNQKEDLLTSLLITKTNKKNLLEIFEESSVFKYKLIENRENIEKLEKLEYNNLVTKINRNNLDKYFINLNGLYYHSRSNFNIELFFNRKNDEFFPKSSAIIKINDEERVFIILLILLGATSPETALQSVEKNENDLLFGFISYIYNSLFENHLYSYGNAIFKINWTNKKNKNFESFKRNVDSTTKYGIIKTEKNIKFGTKWYLNSESEYLIPALIHNSEDKREVYDESQRFIQMLIKLKRKIDTDYYFSELPKIDDNILNKIKNFCDN